MKSGKSTEKKMATNRAKTCVQKMYTWQKVINDLPSINGRKPSLRAKAKAINDAAETRGLPGRVTFADIERLEQGHEPKGKAKREALGLSALGLGEICPVHDKVCAVKHRLSKITRWRDLPIAELRRAIENRKDYVSND